MNSQQLTNFWENEKNVNKSGKTIAQRSLDRQGDVG